MKLRSLLVLIAALQTALPAQERFEAAQTVSAQGDAVINVRPDQARIQIGVVTQATNAQAAGAQNAKQTSDVLAELKKLLPGSADIRTVNYSIYPNYTQPKEGRSPVISGYNANNTVEVRIDDLSLVGKVIDAATQSGANKVNGIQFTLKDEEKSRTEALGEAAKEARANAESLAKALGMQVKRILRVEEAGSSPIVPLQRMEMARMAAADAMLTPIESGTIQVRASVRVVGELGP